MGYNVPIMAVLCDGRSFSFYKFVDKGSANEFPQFSVGVFPDGDRRIYIDDISQLVNIDSRRYYRNLRKTCDALYYVFLSGYRSGIDAFWHQSLAHSISQGKGRDSIPKWFEAVVQADCALDEATIAWQLYDEGQLEASKASAERAIQFLAERYVARCPSLVAANSNNEFL